MERNYFPQKESIEHNIEEMGNITNDHVVTDTEELVTHKEVKVPATPGSVYGGSRNIMKNTIN